jgi:hypothetical protein
MSNDLLPTSLTLEEVSTNKQYGTFIKLKTDHEYIAEILEEFRNRFINLQQQIDQLKKLRNQHEDFVLKLTEANDAGIQEVLNRLAVLEERARGKR